MYLRPFTGFIHLKRCLKGGCTHHYVRTLVFADGPGFRRYASMSVPPTDAQSTSSASDGETDNRTTSDVTTASRRYHRRCSDPQTLRERGDFQRDCKYGKYRPLIDLPWRQHKRKSYLDEAERLYGRKENWQSVADPALREQLVVLLQDCIRDIIAATRLETQQAYRYKTLCDKASRDYATEVIAGGFDNASRLRKWAVQVSRRASQKTGASGAGIHVDSISEISSEADKEEEALTVLDAVKQDTSSENLTAHTNYTNGLSSLSSSSSTSLSLSHAGSMNKEEAELQREQMRARQEERRRRGERASVEGSTATMDLPPSDAKHRPLSAFPFLRQRALEQEHTLDPSLVDWTAKFFPDDDAQTFAHPPLSSHATQSAHSRNEALPQSSEGSSGNTRTTLVKDKNTAEPEDTVPRAARVHARVRLQSSLKTHYDRRRATFDAEGMFYQVRPPSPSYDDDDNNSALRAPKPREVRGSDLIRHGMTDPTRRPDVVKVPWDVVTKARQQGYSADILRAKERLIRLTRGEDPETMP